MSWGSLPNPFRAVLVGAMLSTLGAKAVPPPSLDARGYQASSDAKASLYLEPAATPGHLQWSAGAWLGYAHRVIELSDASGAVVSVPVRHQFTIDYVAALGLTDRLALGVVLPTVMVQSGDSTADLVPGSRQLPSTALGDLALTAKAALLPAGQLGGFALSALARVSLPTGDSASYLSESAASGELRALAELNLILLSLRGTAGLRVRGAEVRFLDQRFGNELPWGAALGIMPQAFGVDREGRFLATLEAHGALALGSPFAAAAQSPTELGLSLRYTRSDLAFTLGGEVPLSDSVGAPLARAVFGVTYAPRVVDTDDDGIPDEVDQCAELAEDLDGFEDRDGCPDFDNDDDGVPDDSDKCPKQQEDSDGFQDEDGCPDPDNDQDSVPDAKDACPLEPGPTNGVKPGCPQRDRDVDGIPDPLDRCPTQPEDRDAHQDEDGCPDTDDDGDGVHDPDDRCPTQAGPERSEPEINGCPSPDRDGDSFDDDEDRCPDQPEDFDGQGDADGCPDPSDPNRPLARLELVRGRLELALRTPLLLRPDGSLDPKSEPSVRAIAQLLNQRPDVSLMVGVRATRPGPEAEQLALNHSFAVVEALRGFTHRDEAAETIGFSAVKKLPGAERGVGFLVLGGGAK